MGPSLNGEAVSEKVLRHGDAIKVGSSIFKCMERDDIEEIEPEYIARDHDRASNVKTLRVQRDGVLFPNTVSLQMSIVATERQNHDLRATGKTRRTTRKAYIRPNIV